MNFFFLQTLYTVRFISHWRADYPFEYELSFSLSDSLIFILFIYLWLCWVFLAAQASLQLCEWGSLSSCGARASLVMEHGL